MIKLLLSLIILPFKILFEKIKHSIEEFAYKATTKAEFSEVDITGHYDGNYIYLSSSNEENLKYIGGVQIEGNEYTPERVGDSLRIKFETAQVSILPITYRYKNETRKKMLQYKNSYM